MSKTLKGVIPSNWQQWSQSRPTVVRQLTGGQTNQAFLVQSEKDLLVLRINSNISNALDLNRSAEACALSYASSNKLCAPIVYCDPDYQYLVTRFIDGTSWQKSQENSLEDVADLLHAIHALPAINTHLNIEEKVDNYWHSIDRQAIFYTPLYELEQPLLSHITAAKSLNNKASLCHNDLTKGNLIIDQTGKLLVIDWEYAAMGDCFYDIATLVEEFNLNRPQQQALLKAYLQSNTSNTDWQRLHHWQLIYNYLCLLWYGVRWSNQKTSCPQLADQISSKCQQLLQAASRP